MLLAIICAGFICFALSISNLFGFQNVDDAYISFRYGWNLMEGNGLVYNKGEYVEGYTNFLWTMLTAPFTKMGGIDITVFTIAIGILISVLILILVTLTTRNLIAENISLLILLPALTLSLDSSFVFWAVSGMETTLFTFLILGFFYFYSRLNDKPLFTNLTAIFLILAALCRPEGNLLFAIFFLNMIVYRRSFSDHRVKLTKITLIYGSVMAVYYGIKYLSYGSVIPNTFYAKAVTDTSNNLAAGLDYIRVSFKARFVLLLPLLFFPFARFVKDYRANFMLSFVLIYICYIIYAGGDWPGSSRFIIPLLPYIYILSAGGLVNIYEKTRRSEYTYKKYASAAIVFIAFSFALFNGVNTFKKLEPYTFLDETYITYEMECTRLGKELKGLNNPQMKIALAPAGKLAYYSQLYCIDMWGLNDEHIAMMETKTGTVAHKKFDFDYILSQKPDLIIGYAGFTDEMVPYNYIKVRESKPENGFLPIFELKN